MPSLAAAPLRIALFLPDLGDRPDRVAAVGLANDLLRAGAAVDVVAPTGGGPLRAALDPAVGQIDLGKRHAATSFLALARVLAERQPSLLAVPREAAWVGRLALRLARSGATLVLLDGDAGADRTAIRAAMPRSG